MQNLWRYRSYVVIFLLTIIASVIWYSVYAASLPGKLTVAFMDVGQGDSIYIESPTGVEIVIDGGPDNSILRDLPTVMAPFDRSLDAIIETHPDADHIGGFVDLLERYEVETFIEPGILKDTATAKALLRGVDEEGAQHVIACRGMYLDLGGGAELYILFPDFDVSTLSASKSNEGGIVARLVYGATSMLFMADVSKKVEDRLVELEGENLQSDVLKIGHHGSKNSTGEQFLATVLPAAAIISVGDHNKYGHPTQEVLTELSTQNIKTLRTDEEGTIIFVSDGKEFLRKN